MLTESRTLSDGGALEVGDHSLLEDGSEHGGALPSDVVLLDTARDGWGHSVRGQLCPVCQWALTQKQTTLGSWFERRATYCSDRSVELPLRPSAIAAPPSGPSWLAPRLRGVGSEVGGEPCQWALT